MLRIKKPLTITGTALAAGAIAITALAPASAMSRDDLSSRLQKQGYTITVDAAAVDHPTLDIDGRVLTVSKGGKSAVWGPESTRSCWTMGGRSRPVST